MVFRTFLLNFIGFLCWIWPIFSVGAPTEKNDLSEILSAFREEITQARVSLNFEILNSSYGKFDFFGRVCRRPLPIEGLSYNSS